MTSLNMRPNMFCRAAMEGATYGLRYGLDVIKRNGIQSKEIRLTGGGAKSNQWCQMVVDIFSCELVRITEEEAGAIGAALQALWCYSVTSNKSITIEEITTKFVKLDESSRLRPNPSTAPIYDEIYQKYLKINDAMYSLPQI